MELQQLEATQFIEAENNFNRESLKVISKLNPCLAEDEILLLSYYKQVRNTWSSSAIKNLKDAEGLKLTNKLNRCKFAIAAARLQLQFVSSDCGEQVTYATGKSKEFPFGEVPEDNPFSESLTGTDKSNISPFQVEVLESEALQIAKEQIQLLESQLKEKEEVIEQQEKQLKQSENFSFLLLSHRLLAPGLPLNGTENTPAMRVLGSPKTLTELHANYREILKREHPDVSPFSLDVAIERFAYVQSLYKITREHYIGRYLNQQP